MEFSIKKNIRKHKDIISVIGYGLVLFVLWNFIKSILFLVEYIPNSATSDELTYSIFYLIVSIIDALTTFVCGILAQKEGKKDKKIGIFLRILEALVIIFALWWVVLDILTICLSKEFDIVIILTTIIDSVFLFFATQLFVSSIKLTKLYKLERLDINEC